MKVLATGGEHQAVPPSGDGNQVPLPAGGGQPPATQVDAGMNQNEPEDGENAAPPQEEERVSMKVSNSSELEPIRSTKLSEEVRKCRGIAPERCQSVFRQAKAYFSVEDFDSWLEDAQNQLRLREWLLQFNRSDAHTSSKGTKALRDFVKVRVMARRRQLDNQGMCSSKVVEYVLHRTEKAYGSQSMGLWAAYLDSKSQKVAIYVDNQIQEAESMHKSKSFTSNGDASPSNGAIGVGSSGSRAALHERICAIKARANATDSAPRTLASGGPVSTLTLTQDALEKLGRRPAPAPPKDVQRKRRKEEEDRDRRHKPDHDVDRDNLKRTSAGAGGVNTASSSKVVVEPRKGGTGSLTAQELLGGDPSPNRKAATTAGGASSSAAFGHHAAAPSTTTTTTKKPSIFTTTPHGLPLPPPASSNDMPAVSISSSPKPTTTSTTTTTMQHTTSTAATTAAPVQHTSVSSSTAALLADDNEGDTRAKLVEEDADGMISTKKKKTATGYEDVDIDYDDL
ncbi:unnamed protein product [Amoebophrya sp. A25]|nr:unnamed protein product [Amoebophrya sp. A25]|eukprot:GSA25T00025480001.1